MPQKCRVPKWLKFFHPTANHQRKIFETTIKTYKLVDKSATNLIIKRRYVTPVVCTKHSNLHASGVDYYHLIQIPYTFISDQVT